MPSRVEFGQDTEAFFQRFTLIEQIGIGGFAKVHRGLDRLSNDFVAIKIRRFSSQQVQHENIIRLICTYVAQTKVFIVTELASGGELLQRISDAGSFSEKDACAVVSQILKGVEYLHKRNIVHRDLKLENIMLSNLTPQAKVKIADFGLARYFADDSQLRTICGSPLYVAPEILDIGTNSETYTPAVDMWSIGVIVYILLTGNSPFDVDDEQILFQKIRSGEYSMGDHLWDHISTEAKDCVQRLLTVDTTARMTVNAALNHPWITGACNFDESTCSAQLMEVKRNRFVEQLRSFRLVQEEQMFTRHQANGIDSGAT
mmetsp:Transcript_6576/g.17763  ORF Transcript_6576/g.17763 Transcript_6576/m.17763 type:complete len:316 (-) Transcript_6576:2271-3218(-)